MFKIPLQILGYEMSILNVNIQSQTI